MKSVLLVSWFLLALVILVVKDRLLIVLLALEILSFLALVILVLAENRAILISDYLVLVLFSVFVIEGVIALSGLILLVRFTGSDYVSSSSFLKC